MATISEIKQKAQLVKDATQVGENTATRVGGVLVDLANQTEAINTQQTANTKDIADLKSTTSGKADTSTVTTLQSQVSTNTTDIADLGSIMGTMEGDISSLKTDVAKKADNALTTPNVSLPTELEGIEEMVMGGNTTLPSVAQGNYTRSLTNERNIKLMQTQVTANTDAIKKIANKPTDNSLRNDLSSKETSGASLVGYKGIEVYEDDGLGGQAIISEAQPKTVEEELDDLHQKAYTNESNITALQNNIPTITQTLTDSTTDVPSSNAVKEALAEAGGGTESAWADMPVMPDPSEVVDFWHGYYDDNLAYTENASYGTWVFKRGSHTKFSKGECLVAVADGYNKADHSFTNLTLIKKTESYNYDSRGELGEHPYVVVSIKKNNGVLWQEQGVWTRSRFVWLETLTGKEVSQYKERFMNANFANFNAEAAGTKGWYFPILKYVANVLGLSVPLETRCTLTPFQLPETGMNKKVNGIFGYQFALVREINLSAMDIAGMTNLNRAFAWCFWLEKVTGWMDTSKVTDTGELFVDCPKLKVCDISLDLSQVTNTQQMFSGCSSLTQLPDVLDLSSSTNTQQMFSGCSSLTSLTINSLAACTNAKWLVAHTEGLTELHLPDLPSTITNIGSTDDSNLFGYYNDPLLTTITTGKVSCSLALNHATSLTHDCATAIIANLDADNPATLTLPKALQSSITDAELAVGTAKGWTIAFA